MSYIYKTMLQCFIFQAKDGIMLSYGKHLQTASTVYQLLLLLMRKFSAVMEVLSYQIVRSFHINYSAPKYPKGYNLLVSIDNCALSQK